MTDGREQRARRHIIELSYFTNQGFDEDGALKFIENGDLSGEELQPPTTSEVRMLNQGYGDG